MRKQYEKPELKTESFEIEDVITASGLGQTSTDGMQTILDPGDHFGALDI